MHKDGTIVWLVAGKVILDNDYQNIAEQNWIVFTYTEYYLSVKYHTKEFVIRLCLSAFSMTVKYITYLASP